MTSLICVLPRSRAAHLNKEIIWLDASAAFGTPISWLVGCRFEYQRLRRLFDYFRDLPQISFSRSATVVPLRTLHPSPYSHSYYHHCLYHLQHIYYSSKFACKINEIHARYVSELFLSSLSIKHAKQRFERKLPSSSSPENFSLENESKPLAKLSDDRKVTIQISDILHITRLQTNYTIL